MLQMPEGAEAEGSSSEEEGSEEEGSESDEEEKKTPKPNVKKAVIANLYLIVLLYVCVYHTLNIIYQCRLKLLARRKLQPQEAKLFLWAIYHSMLRNLTCMYITLSFVSFTKNICLTISSTGRIFSKMLVKLPRFA